MAQRLGTQATLVDAHDIDGVALGHDRRVRGERLDVHVRHLTSAAARHVIRAAIQRKR